MIRLKRVYEPAAREDGFRVLVERLWPRGLTKEKAAVDMWSKETSPSAELRKWFGHDPARWEEFRDRYWRELDRNQEAVGRLKEAVKDKDAVTFVYAAHEQRLNAAAALKEFLERRSG